MGSRVKEETISDRYGSRKSCNTRTVRGIGFMGEGNYSSYKDYLPYQHWIDMIKRCYCVEFLNKNTTYIGCTVHQHWHNFQNFANWFYSNYQEGWKLDKDILVPGNKIYGPDTCCFVPQSINSQFTVVKARESGLPRGVQIKGKIFRVEGRRKDDGKKTYLKPDIPFKTAEEAHEAWKIYKTNHIIELAKYHKDTLNSRVYNALINVKL
jgi:hypothetical protein